MFPPLRPSLARHRLATFSALGAASLLALVAACGDGPTAPALPVCEEDLELTVTPTSDDGPRVSWDAACAVTFMAIGDTLNAFWAIRVADARLRSPQQVFRTPAGVNEYGRARTLQTGQLYYIVVGVRDTSPTGVIGERILGDALYTAP